MKSVVVRDLFNLVGVPSLPVDLTAKQPARNKGTGGGGQKDAPETGVTDAETEAELERLALCGNGFRTLPVD
eukprot:COSAG02_NODE_2351_length_9081_cov_101.624137_2_plen_72_part_00